MTGTERKVFQKYYPPDFDPAKIPRAKGKRSKQFVQRVMTPCNMQCNTCNEYIYKGKKFNMKRETAEGEFYLGLRIFRFYFKCPNCLAEITFKTDLENCDYQMEHGATRLFEAFKVYQDAEKVKEAKEAEDAKDPMKMLEKRTKASRAEMEAMGKLEELQEMNRRAEGVDIDNYLDSTDKKVSMAEALRWQEKQDEAFISDLYGKTEDGRIQRRIKDEEDASGDEAGPGPSSSHVREAVDKKPDLSDLKPSFDKPPPGKRPADTQRSLLQKMVVVKRKKEVKQEPHDDDGPGSSAPPAPPPAAKPAGLLGLADYGSGSDSD